MARSPLALLATLLFAAAAATSFAADSFDIAISTNRVGPGKSILVSIQAHLANGNADTNFAGEYPLELKRRVSPGLVISEIETTNRVVEFVNTSSAPLNIGGWEYQFSNNSEVFAHLRFPDGYVVPGMGVVLFSNYPLPDSTVPVFTPQGPPRDWLYGFHTLRDSSGNVIDHVAQINPPTTRTDFIWNGSPLATRPGPWARIGKENHFSTNDWLGLSFPSRGEANPSLELPWVGSDVTQKTISIQFTNGHWMGMIPIDLPPLSSAILFIRDDLNHFGSSQRIEVESVPALAITFEPAVNNASEAASGVLGNGFVHLPEPAFIDTTISLVSSDPTEFQVPATVQVPVGQSSAPFPVTNFDDSSADGAVTVVISASGGPFASAEATLINRDNESGRMFVVLPFSANEDSGFQPELGRVFIAEPAQKDVLVQLRADPILRVPSTVTIPRGRSSALFKFSVGDDRFYSSAYYARVWARTENWPEAEGRIRIEDNDDWKSTLTIPSIVWQGELTEAVVTFATPRHADTKFDIYMTFGVLQTTNVILPAGATELRIPLKYISAGQERIQFSADGNSYDRFLMALPNTPAISSLFIHFSKGAVFSGEPFAISATLGDPAGTQQYTNVTGEIRLLNAAGLVNFAPQQIRFTNGYWAGTLSLTGFASGLQFELSAAGFTNQTARFDLLKGGLARLSPLDMAWLSRSNLFLISQGPRTNATGRLIALAPPDATNIVKSLALPAPATAISVSEDESFAWLVLANGQFQKVDLTQWSLGTSIPVSTNAAEIARDILVLPGTNDQFVAVVGAAAVNPAQSRLQLFVNGAATTNIAAIPNSGPLAGADLVRGRDASEFFYQGPWNLVRFSVSNGLVPQGTAPVVSASYVDGKLYSGTQGVVDPATLGVDNRFGFSDNVGGPVFVFPEISRLYLINQNTVNAYDLVSGKKVGTASLQNLIESTTILKSQAWSKGFAYLINDAVLFIQSPLIEPTQPDLSLTFLGPTERTNTLSFPNDLFEWQFEAVNHGPGPAPSVVVSIQGVGDVQLGSLQPNEHRVFSSGLVHSDGGLFSAPAEITSALVDPNPANNRVTAQTVVKTSLKFSGTELAMKAWTLASSPDRSRVFAAFYEYPGFEGHGIAVINPNTGAIERLLTNGITSTRLAVSSDNQFLYALSNTNEVKRWNLQTGLADQTINTGPDPVLDIAVPPSGAGRVVVATTARVDLYQNGVQLGAGIARTQTFRSVGFSGADLWMAEPGLLYRLSVGDAGITQVGSTSVLPNGSQHFVADATRLYFGNYYVTLSDRLVTYVNNGLFPFPELNTVISFEGSRVRTLAASNLQPIGDDFLPFIPYGEAARFGDTGLAYLAANQQVILYNLSALQLPGTSADLQLIVTPPALPYTFMPLEWQFEIRNNSSDPAPNARLLTSTLELRDAIWTPQSMSIFGESAIDLGSIGGGESKLVKLQARSYGGNASLSVRAYSNAIDLIPTNNTFTTNYYFRYPPGDLEMLSSVGPTNAAKSETITYTFNFRNNGAIEIPNAIVELQLGDAVELLDGIPAPVPLAPAQSASVQVRLRMTQGGITSVSGRMRGLVEDSNPSNDGDSYLVYVSDPTARMGQLTVPSSRLLAWNEPRRELIAAFPESQRSVLGLDPGNLRPRWSVNLESPPDYLTVTDDGKYVWCNLSGGRVNRVNIETGAVDLSFNLPGQFPIVWSIATPPGKPDQLYVSFDPNQTGQNRVQLFENGVPKPAFINGSGHVAFTSSGRIFVTASQFLREITTNQQGLVEVENLDSIAPWGQFTISVVDDTIFYSIGRAYNTVTRQTDNALFETPYGVVGDPITRQRYRIDYSNLSFGRVYYLENYALEETHSDWRSPIPEPGGILPMGTNGVLTIGENLFLTRINPAEKSADLSIVATAPATVAGPELPFQLNISVTNKSVWRADGAELSITLPPGASIQDGELWVTTSPFKVQLGSLHGSTNIAFSLKSASVGVQTFSIDVTSAIADPISTSNHVDISTTVAELPIVLIDDVAQPESSGFIQAWLSAPTPVELKVRYNAFPLTASAGDITQQTDFFKFPANTAYGSAFIFFDDSTPEFDETVRLELSSDTISLIRTQIVVTAINDDFPRLTMSQTGSTFEGNTNRPLVITVTLPPSPFPSQVEYETISGTAFAERDFVAQSGRLRFPASETNITNFITLEILGNTAFEPTKTFSLALKNPVSLALQSSSLNITLRNDDPPPAPSIAISGGITSPTLLQFNALANVTYRLQSRTNLVLGDWVTSSAVPSIVGTNGQFGITRPTIPTTFYRVRAILN